MVNTKSFSLGCWWGVMYVQMLSLNMPVSCEGHSLSENYTFKLVLGTSIFSFLFVCFALGWVLIKSEQKPTNMFEKKTRKFTPDRCGWWIKMMDKDTISWDLTSSTLLCVCVWGGVFWRSLRPKFPGKILTLNVNHINDCVTHVCIPIWTLTLRRKPIHRISARVGRIVYLVPT